MSVYASGQQQDILNREVAAYVAKGYAVESTTPGQAIVSRRAPYRMVLQHSAVHHHGWVVVDRGHLQAGQP